MAATVVSLPLPAPLDVDMNPAEARKRRREILASQRNAATATPDVSSSTSDAAVLDNTATNTGSNKRRRVSNDFLTAAVVSPTTPSKKALMADDASSTSTGKKKPQMKYEPETPMTKEEAAVWRREQRRKRNRESAAASRQRQRDRIVELEAEVEEWKVKFEDAMKRIRELEAGKDSANTGVDAFVPAAYAGSNPQLELPAGQEEVLSADHDMESSSSEEEICLVHSPEELVEEVFRDTTILVSPSQSPRSVSPMGSPVIDYSQVQAVKVVSQKAGQVSPVQEQIQVVFHHQEKSHEPSKMISRPA